MSEELNHENIASEKTQDATDKKCPACGGTVEFDPSSGGLVCPFCGTKYEIEAKKDEDEQTAAKELDFDSVEARGNCDWGAKKKTIICKMCGAESIYDELDLSNECPYCGSNQVMEEKDVDTLAPGGVCPFKIDKKSAGERFKSWIKGKLFCPKEAKEKAKPEAFKGVYIPVWTFDTDTYSDYTAQYGKERRVRNSKGETRTVIDWYTTSGTYREFINDNLQIATNRYDTAILKAIQPFNTEENLIYKPEYITGFISERYSVGLDESWEKAQRDIENILRSGIASDVQDNHFTSHVRNIAFSTEYSNIKFKYLLLPIWISSFKYKGKIYNFMVNGQTGKVGGKTPISPLRVTIAVVIAIILLILAWNLFSGSGAVHVDM